MLAQVSQAFVGEKVRLHTGRKVGIQQGQRCGGEADKICELDRKRRQGEACNNDGPGGNRAEVKRQFIRESQPVVEIPVKLVEGEKTR